MMWATFLNKLRWSYQKNAPDLIALFMRNYPDFVFSRGTVPIGNEIPVFVFHSVEPVSFEEKLAFLAGNNYRTLNGEEFRAAIAGETRESKQSVLLTFDDGIASLWTVAFPLLQKYGFKAVSFIIPGCITDHVPESPTFIDYEKKRVPAKSLLAREQGNYPLCSWQEIKEMHASGVIDFQSHTMYHHRIHVSSLLVDFIHPDFDFHFHSNVNVPVYRVRGKLDFARQMPWGTPVYRFEPVMQGHLQYFDDQTVRAACVEHVLRWGGEKFFLRKDWRKRLQKVHHQACQCKNNAEYETPAGQEKAIFEDIRQAKVIVEGHLPGKTVDHLCYPWFMGSPLAVEQSRRAGYRVNYWGISPRRKTNRPGDDLFYVPRLEDQYLFRLPGKGRKSLMEIVDKKFRTNMPHFVRRLKIEA
jgi:hypothetical protein